MKHLVSLMKYTTLWDKISAGYPIMIGFNHLPIYPVTVKQDSIINKEKFKITAVILLMKKEQQLTSKRLFHDLPH